MTSCPVLASGDIELFYYGELAEFDRRRVAQHLLACRDCRQLLDELGTIAAALATSPDVSAPPGGDWSRFMARLDTAVRSDVPSAVVDFRRRESPHRAARPRVAARSFLGYVALAAMLALVTMSIVTVLRDRSADVPQVASGSADSSRAAADAPAGAPGDADAVSLSALTGQHFERSKLVILGLATKDADGSSVADWTYERQLASDLLADTRLYRMAAEQHGMNAVATVMRDLEIVLLQASLGESADPETLGQIQRLIRKRDLVTKMNVLTTGL